MKKTLLAGAMALSLCTAATTASAIAIDVTAMVFGSTSAATGSVDTNNLGTTFNGSFFNAPWTATTQAAFTSSDTWAGTSPQGAYSYNFTLTAGQVAFGTYFDWSVTSGIPVLAVFDCGAGNPGDACTGIPGYPMQNGPFPGQNPVFNGTVAAGPPVPVPAAVWLFGSGMLGLVGVARRKLA
jgi:hypothetical protein